MSLTYGMHFNDKIGDGLIYSSCPENFYKAGKGKVLDVKKVWFFARRNRLARRSPNISYHFLKSSAFPFKEQLEEVIENTELH